jgi:hypothetical protein
MRRRLPAAAISGASSALDEGVVFAPRFFGDGTARRGFHDLAVAVELAALQLADDEVRAMPGPRVKFLGDGARQFLGVGVALRDALCTLRDFFGRFASAVWRGDDDGQIARQVFDVVLFPEITASGLKLRGGQFAGNARGGDGEEELPAVEERHGGRGAF